MKCFSKLIFITFLASNVYNKFIYSYLEDIYYSYLEDIYIYEFALWKYSFYIFYYYYSSSFYALSNSELTRARNFFFSFLEQMFRLALNYFC